MSVPPSADAVLARLQQVAREHLGRDAPLCGHHTLAEDVAPDSLQRMTLVVETENAFAVCLDDDEMAALVTVDDVVAVLLRHLQRSA